MIEILGANEATEEYRAAIKFRKIIINAWPEIESLENDKICIIPGAKCFGQQVQDIDLVVLGKFSKPRLLPDLAWMDGEKLLLSFALTIEVKSHHPNGLEVQGNKVFVKYKGGIRKDATEQSHNQKFALKSFLESNKIDAPYIINMVWLLNADDSILPKSDHNILTSNSNWNDVLKLIAINGRERLDSKNQKILIAYAQSNWQVYFERLYKCFSQKLENATSLDRKKVERITRRSINNQNNSEDLDGQLLIYRGRGGTGKTMRLLMLAYTLWEDSLERTLLLTYNHALASDIKRTLAIIGVEIDSDGPVITVKTVHKFMFNLIKGLELLEEDKNFINCYDYYLQIIFENIDALNTNDIPEFDHILIDEAQDWPEMERNIIFKLYGPEKCIVADGVDQLTRSSIPTDWTARIGNVKKKLSALRQSLRLKSVIAEFTNNFATQMNIPGWNIGVNHEINGGRVTVIIGSLINGFEVFESAFNELKVDGNMPIDSLFCVPYKISNWNGRIEFDQLVDKLQLEYWDGTDDDIRTQFPTSVAESRVVTYESCRGLEGWSVFCIALDELYDNKYKHYKQEGVQRDLLLSESEIRTQFASKWTMIPLTRAIDHLVIHIHNPEHLLAKALESMSGSSKSEDGSFRVFRI